MPSCGLSLEVLLPWNTQLAADINLVELLSSFLHQRKFGTSKGTPFLTSLYGLFALIDPRRSMVGF